MSARDALFSALWDNYTQAQKNEFIDAFAHELANSAPDARAPAEPMIHSGLTDALDDTHLLAHETVYCDGPNCRDMLHHGINENMQTWVEANRGNYCLPCFAELDADDGSDAWGVPK